MLLGTLGATLLGNLLIRTGEKQIKVGEGTIRANQDFNVSFSFK